MTNEITYSESFLKEFQLGIKLEGIFMPHTRDQRDKIYKMYQGSSYSHHRRCFDISGCLAKPGHF